MASCSYASSRGSPCVMETSFALYVEVYCMEQITRYDLEIEYLMVIIPFGSCIGLPNLKKIQPIAGLYFL